MFFYGKNVRVETSWIENIFISDSYNAIASSLVNETRLLNAMSLHEICNPASESLSFSHKLAAKGFIVVLLKIEEQFGSHALSCTNKNNITTQTLFNFFHHFDKFPIFFGEFKPANDELLTSLFLKILLDFKPFVFPKYSVERKCNYRIKNFRNIRSMELCVFKLEKEYLRLMQQLFKNSGIKSKEDFDRAFNDKHDCFAKYNDALKSMNENPKSSIEPTCFTEYWILESLQTECSTSSTSSNKINRTSCYQLISSLTQRSKIIVHWYSLFKVRYFFLLLSLYQNKINIPFEGANRHIFIYNGAKLAELYFQSAYLRSSMKLNVHMSKKYKFLDWFKSCKNCLAEVMMKRISSLTTREIRKWKGSVNNVPMKLFCTSQHVSEDVNAPLKNYYSSFGYDNDDDVT